jgi:hypothetical protein
MNERRRAIGVWSATAASGSAAGVLASGILTTQVLACAHVPVGRHDGGAIGSTIKPLVPVSNDPQKETVEALLERSGRRTGRVNIRAGFVQSCPQRKPVPGPIRAILRAHDERSLDVFLLHRAVVSKAIEDDEGKPSWHSYPLDARVWARALGLGKT